MESNSVGGGNLSRRSQIVLEESNGVGGVELSRSSRMEYSEVGGVKYSRIEWCRINLDEVTQ